MLHLVFYLAALLLFLPYFPSLQQACNQQDQHSLLSLNFNSSSPPLNWSFSIQCCLWEGINCDANGRVTHLWLPRRSLTTSISHIANLTHLTHLNLSHNQLFGPLPSGSFSSLTHLETLDLSYNFLVDQFPSSLSSNSLKVVDLSSNHFYGMIPSLFFQFAKNLTSFNVSNNSFTGLIPSPVYIDSLCSITLLDFSHNYFSDKVPPGLLGNCSKLRIFRAGFNNLSGSLPEDIYLATSLEEISLPVNLLSGPIGNGILNLINLTVIELYSNQLIGSIPEDIGKLSNLKKLHLQMKNLSGSLPPSMKNCTNLTTLNLRVNFIEGDLSAFNFSTLLQLHTIDLGNNKFIGNFPLTLISCKLLTAIRLSGNQLEGQILPDIVELKSLSYLSLSNNSLTNVTGAINILAGCKNLSVLIISKNFFYEAMPDDDHITSTDGFLNLQVLALGGCRLNGRIPAWISKLKNLQVLDLSENKISGSIPEWVGNMSSLFYIDLSQNFISGKFPKKLSGLRMLISEEATKQVDRMYLELPVFVTPRNATAWQYNQLSNLPPAIYLRNNSLSGSIPNEIGQLKSLHVLDLSHNEFSGNIPDQLSQLTNLEVLDLSVNRLSGEIPASLRSLHFLSYFSVAENDLQGLVP